MGRVKEAYEAAKIAEMEEREAWEIYDRDIAENWVLSEQEIEEMGREHREALSNESVAQNDHLFETVGVEVANTPADPWLTAFKAREKAGDEISGYLRILTKHMFEPLQEADYWATCAALRRAQERYIEAGERLDKIEAKRKEAEAEAAAIFDTKKEEVA
jgi:hypothetical protein